MDGTLTIRGQNSRRRYCRLPGISRRVRFGLALIVVWFAQNDVGRSADRPNLLSRLGFHTNNKSRQKVEPSVSPASLPDANRSGAADGDRNDSVKQIAETKPVRETDNSGLQRFPSRSSSDSLSSNRVSEFSLNDDEPATSIDLPTALQLAGWTSPEVLLAQQRVLAANARQQLAAAQALPNLNLGTTFYSHTGAVQASSGQILSVERSSLYVGAGGNAVGSGTVNIPGVQYNMNVNEAYFGYLVSRQKSERAQAGAVAARNNILLQVAVAYCQLVREQGTRAIAIKVRDDAKEVARITAAFAKAGQGRQSDAERAMTELGRREADIFTADATIIEVSARLGQILNLESSVRLQSRENWIVPRSIVPEPIPLPELIAIALYQRPEIAERRAEVHAAMLELDGAKLLLFSPQFIAGFSDGAFGGGGNVNVSNTGRPRFGDFGDRTDVDLVLYWSIRNLGLANRALIKTATARLAAADWDRTKRLNEIRAEVADAYARTQARSAQLDLRERAVTASEQGFQEDLKRAYAGEGRPIEVLDSLRLRATAQQDYLDTIASYNQAQYELYVAIGQPPADLMIHTAPPTVPPSPVAESKR